MTRGLVSMFPAAARLAELAAYHGPAHAIAAAITPALVAITDRVWHSLRSERPAPMSKLLSLRALTAAVIVVVAVAAPVAAQPGATPSITGTDRSSLDADVADLFVDGGLTADQAADRAAVAAPEVWRAAAEVEAAAADVSVAKLQRLPYVTYTLKYTRLSSVGTGDPAPGKSTEELLNRYSAGVDVVIPLSDQLLRLPNLIDAAKDGVRAAKAGQRATELDAATNARLAYYEWVRARLQQVIAQHQLAQIGATLDQVRALASAQRVSKADLLRVESEQAQIQQTVDQLGSLAALREEALRIRIGAQDTEVLAIGEDLRSSIAAPQPSSLDELTATAISQRLEFKKIDLGLDANHEQSLAERASQLPRLSAFTQTSYANPSDRVFPPEDELTMSWAAGLQLTWSPNDALTAKHTKHRLRAEAAALRADRASLAHATRLEVLSAQQDVALAEAALTTSQTGLVAAEEGYRVRKAQLDAQRATAVELVDAETDLTRARIAALDARIDLRIALAQLDHALGNDAE